MTQYSLTFPILFFCTVKKPASSFLFSSFYLSFSLLCGTEKRQSILKIGENAKKERKEEEGI